MTEKEIPGFGAYGTPDGYEKGWQEIPRELLYGSGQRLILTVKTGDGKGYHIEIVRKHDTVEISTWAFPPRGDSLGHREYMGRRDLRAEETMMRLAGDLK